MSEREQRFEALVEDFISNGFTREQAQFLILLLEDFIPLVG